MSLYTDSLNEIIIHDHQYISQTPERIKQLAKESVVK